MSNIQFEEKTYNTDSLDIGLWKKILSLLGRSKKHLIALAVLMVFMAMLDVVRPYLDKIAIDYFAKGDFKTEEIIIAIFTGSSNANGFKPGEFEFDGSIRFTGIL